MVLSPRTDTGAFAPSSRMRVADFAEVLYSLWLVDKLGGDRISDEAKATRW